MTRQTVQLSVQVGESVDVTLPAEDKPRATARRFSELRGADGMLE
jgi:hypothetical protein